MKKVLLSLSILASSLLANAQVWTADLSKEGAGGPTTPAYFGANTAGYTTAKTSGQNNVVLTRSTAGTNNFESMSFTINDGENPQIINLSGTGNAVINVTFSSSTAARLRVDIKDVNGYVSNFAAATFTGSATSVTHTFVINPRDAYSPAGAVTGSCTPSVANPCLLDLTQIVEILFSLNDGSAITENEVVNITAISAGALSTSTKAANIASSVVFPNPASDAVFANLNLKASNDVTVVVTDLMGRQVATRSFGRVTEINNAEIFNAASLAKGMYTVTYVLDGTPAKSDLVVVK
ncbi:MAG: T9SS type A sorting domain-containing protein [Cytophagaceae bacterium]|jgi:hypothetical protein|nr:T9SS type A sorting domain-containing protein [Cytophagaceae bacterium]